MRMARPLLVFLGLAAAGAACDTRAQSSTASAATGVPDDPERLSKEHESCGATAHCVAPLRCFEQSCQRVDRSVLGDYHAALGANAREGGDVDRALIAYDQSIKQYKADGLAPPADVECAYGSVLIEARAIEDNAELAARVLHRCINGAPPGSALRQAALRQIAVLDEAGFDPLHLARPDQADKYLKQAPRPKTDALAIAVSANPTPTSKGWAGFAEAVKAAKGPLVACWEGNFKATKAAAMTVTVPLKSSYKDSGYDDEPGYYVTGVDAKAPAAANAAEQCVRDAVAALAKSAKGLGEVTTALTITVQ